MRVTRTQWFCAVFEVIIIILLYCNIRYLRHVVILYCVSASNGWSETAVTLISGEKNTPFGGKNRLNTRKTHYF